MLETDFLWFSVLVVGFEVPDKFVVGYALDYNEYFRDLNVSTPDLLIMLTMMMSSRTDRSHSLSAYLRHQWHGQGEVQGMKSCPLQLL